MTPIREDLDEEDDDLLLDAYMTELMNEDELENDDSMIDVPPFPVTMTPKDNAVLFACSTPSANDDYSDDSSFSDDDHDETYVDMADYLDCDDEQINDDFDEHGQYVELYVDENLAPAILEEHQHVGEGERATMRVYVSKELKRSVVVKEDDLLTKKELQQRAGVV